MGQRFSGDKVKPFFFSAESIFLLLTIITETLYNSVTMIQQLINDEKFTNIQKAQAGLTRLFLHAQNTSSFYRVLKNDKSLGVLVPENIWMSLTEDLEALSSPNYRLRIVKARKDKKTYTSSQLKKRLGL